MDRRAPPIWQQCSHLVWGRQLVPQCLWAFRTEALGILEAGQSEACSLHWWLSVASGPAAQEAGVWWPRWAQHSAPC